MQRGAGSRVQEVPEEEEGDWVVDLQELFRRFDRRFFHSRLAARVQVSWSSTLRRSRPLPSCLPLSYLFRFAPFSTMRGHRETGECVVRSRWEGGGVFVNLSEPILQYRSKSDIIDALLVAVLLPSDSSLGADLCVVCVAVVRVVRRVVALHEHAA
jgi:hypothetical protein